MRGGIEAGTKVPAATPVTPKRREYEPWSSLQTYLFQSTGGTSFTVLAGVGAPTITGGFANISNIGRPRRKGYTQATGYDPITMDVPVRFEASVTLGVPVGSYLPADVEDDIMLLEGMAGRGKRVSTNGLFHAALGDPPRVQVYANTQAYPSNLIPPNVHGLLWYIVDLTYDPNPLRSRAGNRKQQDVVVHLSEVVNPPTRSGPKLVPYVLYRSTLSLDTVQRVVAHFTRHRSATAYRRVLAYSREHGARYKSYTQRLKPGTAVYIPRDL